MRYMISDECGTQYDIEIFNNISESAVENIVKEARDVYEVVKDYVDKCELFYMILRDKFDEHDIRWEENFPYRIEW